MLTRRGFSLVELLIALVVGSVVMTAMFKAIVGTQQVVLAHSERIEVQQNLRAGAYYLSHVLRELDAVDGDIVIADDNKIQFRSMRWTGVLCNPPVLVGGALHLRLRSNLQFGARGPDADLDSLLIFREGEAGNRADDRWLPGGVTLTAAALCADGGAAIDMTVIVPASVGGADSVIVGVTPGAPIRGFQAEELSLTQRADSRYWIVQRAATRVGTWSSPEPLVGPLTSNGLALIYYDDTGTVTANPTLVSGIELRLRAESRGKARGSTGAIEHLRDSLITHVALRNNP